MSKRTPVSRFGAKGVLSPVFIFVSLGFGIWMRATAEGCAVTDWFVQ